MLSSVIHQRQIEVTHLEEPVALVSVYVHSIAVRLVVVAGRHAVFRARAHSYSPRTSGTAACEHTRDQP